MATFTGTFGNDNFAGTAAGDVFNFDFANFKAGDIVNGGGTASDPKDQLWLTGTQAPFENLNFAIFEHQFPVFPFYSDITSIEQIYLSSSGTSISLTGIFLNTSSTGTVEVFGSGNGNDAIFIGEIGYELRTTTVSVYAGGGDDRISNSLDSLHPEDVFDGGDGNDTIMAKGFLYGGNGNDTIVGDGVIRGGTGDDSIDVRGIGTAAYGDNGNDTFLLSGSVAFGVPTSSAPQAFIDGGDGIDTLQLRTMSAGLILTSIEGVDINGFFGTAADYLAVQQFSPILQLSTTTPTNLNLVGGGTFDMRFIGNGAFDTNVRVYDSPYETYFTTIFGTSGRNTITGGYGSETIYGGNLADTLSGGEAGTDQIFGEGGDDTLYWGTSLATTLRGGAGNDTFTAGIYHGSQSGTAFGDGGDDAFILPSMSSFAEFAINGGAGYDYLYLGTLGNATGSTDDISRFGITGIEYIYAAQNLKATIAQIQQSSALYLATGNLRLLGSGSVDFGPKLRMPNKDLTLDFSASGASTISLSTGNDNILTEHTTSTGDITVYGGDGNDRVTILVDSTWNVLDTAYGGNGNDFFRAATRDSIEAFSKSARFFGEAGNDTFEYYAAGIYDGGEDQDTLRVQTTTLDASNVVNIETLDVWTTSLTTSIADIAKFNSIRFTLDPFYTPQIFKVNLTLTGDGSFDFTGRVIDYGLNLRFSGQSAGVSITASDYADDIVGTEFNDTLLGGAGDDYIRTGLGSDTARGGIGNDILIGEVGDDFLFGEDGNDTLITSQVYGIVMVDFGGNNLADGGSGDDEIRLWGLNDTGLGGLGNDEISIMGQGATARGGDGEDVLFGGENNDRLYGDNGEDILIGGTGNDSIYGGADDDVLIGDAGMDYMDGGDGFDIVSYETASAGVRVDLLFRSGNTNDAVGDSFVNIEAIAGSNFADTLTSTYGDDTVFGLDGNDYINARSGNDTLFGNADLDQIYAGDGNDRLDGGADNDSLYGQGDNDTLIGGAGLDYLDGGAGFDTASYETATVGVRVDLLFRSGNTNDAAGDTFVGIEALTGSNFGDVLTSTYGDDTVNGLGGDDYIDARSGNDTLSGGAGLDQIYAGAGNDSLDGGIDRDYLDGGQGTDTLTGGAGNDTLVGGADADLFRFDSATFNADTITDFQDNLDKFDMSGSGLTFASFTIAQVGADAVMTVTASPTNTITLTNVTASSITAADFV
jgi:Ca2+-binding RTX toxin-like protein